MKTEQQINELLDKVDEFAPSKFSGMSYEQGIAAALQWVLEEFEGSPLND